MEATCLLRRDLGRVPIAPIVAILWLATGCASGSDLGGKRYGLNWADTQEAVLRGEAHEALRYYRAAAEDLERRGRTSDAAKAHAAVAWVALRLGAYDKGLRSGLRALELLREARFVQDPLSERMRAHEVVGITYRRLGQPAEAEQHFSAGLALAEHQAGSYWRAVFLRDLAAVALDRSDYPLALRHGEQAVGLLEHELEHVRSGPGAARYRYWLRRFLAFALNLVGQARLFAGLEGADAALRRAQVIAREVGERELEAYAGFGLGKAMLARGDASAALSQLREALMWAAGVNDAWLKAMIQADIGRSHAWQGRNEDALSAFQESIRLVEDVRSQLQNVAFRSGFAEDKQAIYQAAARVALALGRVDVAFGYAERARARAFLDLLGTQTSLSKGKTQMLVDEEMRLQAQLSEARALAQGEIGGPRPRLEATEHAYRAFLERVRTENPEQASLLTVNPVTLPEIQDLLPEGTTLLEYFVTDREILLWVIERLAVTVVTLPGDRGFLVNQVRAFRQAMTELAPLPQLQTLATALYELLMAPARRHIHGERLLIVPHGILHYLPFAALLGPEGRWLVEDYTLATLPSASLLKYLQEKGAGASTQILAVGNPDLGPTLNLRYAEREAEAVGAHYPGAIVLVRGDATKPRVKALSRQAGLLHFATHAELNEQSPLASALLLAPEGAENGRLDVREIFGLELHARLVVLSACETALGQLSRGDELVGLQRAFLYAGTPAIVTTLWKVDDRASFELMRTFYDNLEALGPAGALRQAQRTVRTEFPHPFAWAGFVVTGSPQ